MINAVFVFEEAQDAKEARAAEWRHAEVFRLKAKCQTNPVIGEEAFQIGVHGLMRTEHRQHFEQAHLHQVLPAEKGALETRLHQAELGAVFIQKSAEAWRVGRSEFRDFAFHPGDVRRRVDMATRAELNPVLWVESHQLDLVP